MDHSFRPPSRRPGPAIPAELRAYWEALRGPAAFPSRDRLDPRGIANALDQTFLVERIAPGIARFRLAGTRLADLMGMDLRGMPMSCLISPPDRDRFSRALEQVFATPSILEVRLEAERGIGRPALAARLLMLPLGDRDGQPSLALGCIALDQVLTGRVPRRFAIASLMRETIATGESLPGGTTAPEAALPGFAEPAAGWIAAAAPRKGHLRLVYDAARPARRP